MRAGDRIPEEILARPVGGVSLAPGSLRDQLDGLTFVVFLRHFGCVFCRETLTDLREWTAKDPGFPTPLFVYQGSPAEGRAFLRRYWPDLRAISDPSGEFYQAFGVERAGLKQMFAPPVWKAQRRAKAKGHGNGKPVGDIWRMPGAHLVLGNEVLWRHEYRHAADHPDYALVSAVATGMPPSG